jgi:hypothetical protein
MSGDIALIKPEGKLVHVPSHVLLVGMMIDAVHPALHYRPNGFNPVRVDIATAIRPYVLAMLVSMRIRCS